MLKEANNYLFMTVTHYFTGHVVRLTPSEVQLDQCAWIPDTGRLSECVASSTTNECEPLGDGMVLQRSAIIAAIPWRGALPSKLK